MKRLTLLLIFLLIPFQLESAGLRKFTLLPEDLLNPEKKEIVAFMINEMFRDLWLEKRDIGFVNYDGRAFLFKDLLDKEMIEKNMLALNTNFNDLWGSKVDVSSGTSVNQRLYTITNILDPKNIDMNAFAINRNFDDLYLLKKDR